MRMTAACCCLALIPASAGAQSGMSRAEAANLYSAAGFSILQNQPVNRCGKPAKPRVTFVDVNGDKQPEALFVDENVDCYAPSGRYFAVLTKEGTGWRSVISGTGSIQALSNRTAGWLDMRVNDSGCVRNHRYDGRTYKAATGCLGEAVGAAPQPAQPANALNPLSPLRHPRRASLQSRRCRLPTRQRPSRRRASRSAAPRGEAAATIQRAQAASTRWST